ARAIINADDWVTQSPYQATKTAELRADLRCLGERLDQQGDYHILTWDQLYRWAERALSLEAQEQLVSLLLEIHPELVDDLATTMSSDESVHFRINGSMPLSDLLAVMRRIIAGRTKLTIVNHPPSRGSGMCPRKNWNRALARGLTSLSTIMNNRLALDMMQ
ncbi:MAG: hypothetical protein VW665_12195, partial [Candidatus Puniceispirillum sp.]